MKRVGKWAWLATPTALVVCGRVWLIADHFGEAPGTTVGNGRAPSLAPANDTRQAPLAPCVRVWDPRSRRAVLVARCWLTRAGNPVLPRSGGV